MVFFVHPAAVMFGMRKSAASSKVCKPQGVKRSAIRCPVISATISSTYAGRAARLPGGSRRWLAHTYVYWDTQQTLDQFRGTAGIAMRHTSWHSLSKKPPKSRCASGVLAARKHTVERHTPAGHKISSERTIKNHIFQLLPIISASISGEPPAQWGCWVADQDGLVRG